MLMNIDYMLNRVVVYDASIKTHKTRHTENMPSVTKIIETAIVKIYMLLFLLFLKCITY